jgi:membrane protease YdiL (CAAX protease family)
VIEEWLCRGVLRAAVRRIVAVRGAILVTAVLFALMHGLQGPALVALPHRFLGGIAFGWLRARFGSLLPCMLAHATVNGLVLAMNTA